MPTETQREVLDCGCVWEVDMPELATRCVTQCEDHPKDRGRLGLLPKPLPARRAMAQLLPMILGSPGVGATTLGLQFCAKGWLAGSACFTSPSPKRPRNSRR